MGECQKCNSTIDDKYKFCLSCVEKMKEDNAKVGAVKNDEDVIKAIGAVNNNLYAIRTILEAMLEKKQKMKLKWDSQNKKFEIVKVKK